MPVRKTQVICPASQRQLCADWDVVKGGGNPELLVIRNPHCNKLLSTPTPMKVSKLADSYTQLFVEGGAPDLPSLVLGAKGPNAGADGSLAYDCWVRDV